MKPAYALGVILILVVSAAPTFAQQPPPGASTAHRFTISGGLTRFGGYPTGDAVAEIRRNATGTTTPPPFTLFRADTDLGSASGLQARIGFGFNDNLTIEVGGSIARPRLGISIFEDPESEPIDLPGSEVTQYIVDFGAMYALPWRLGNRTTPYGVVSVGYLRQLHEDRAVVETGRTFQFGGGARVWLLGADQSRRAVGARVEFTYVMRTGGVDFADERRSFPAVHVLATIGCQRLLCR